MLHLSFERRLILGVSALLAVSAIVGVALTPALSDQVRPMLQSLGIISCTSSGPCQEGKNSGTGPGLEGISAKGKGVIGQTTFNSTSATNGQAGVLGQDKSTSGAFDVGVKGTTTNGIGVEGVSLSSIGIEGISTNNYGLKGIGLDGVAASGTNAAVLADNFTTNSSGYLFVGLSPSGNVFNVDQYGDLSMFGSLSMFGIMVGPIDVQGSSGVIAEATGNSGGDQGVYAQTDYPADWLYRGYSVYHNGITFEVSDGGTAFATGYGTLTATKIAQKTSSGQTLDTYSPQAAEPALEDFGEAQLIGGAAYVALDPKFGSAIEHGHYLVTLTAEGDCNGLYVSERTAAGFSVRELHGGRSSIAFSYRIVGKPFGVSSQRLPISATPKLLGAPAPASVRERSRFHRPKPLGAVLPAQS